MTNSSLKLLSVFLVLVVLFSVQAFALSEPSISSQPLTKSVSIDNFDFSSIFVPFCDGIYTFAQYVLFCKRQKERELVDIVVEFLCMYLLGSFGLYYFFNPQGLVNKCFCLTFYVFLFSANSIRCMLSLVKEKTDDAPAQKGYALIERTEETPLEREQTKDTATQLFALIIFLIYFVWRLKCLFTCQIPILSYCIVLILVCTLHLPRLFIVNRIRYFSLLL